MPKEKRWGEEEAYLRLEYKYEFMPRGMVNQLSAELSRYIVSDEEIWNNAVNLINEENTAFCQIEEDFYNRKIYIKARGIDARGVVIMIMNALKDIADGYKGVKPEIYVPCTCKVCKANAKPTLYLYDDLLRWYQIKEKKIATCNESGEELQIVDLLLNVGLPNPLTEKKGLEKDKLENVAGLKFFVAYSKYDEDYLQEFEDHLITLKGQKLVSEFDCRKIDFGEEWDERIRKEISECDVLVCLVSVKFLNTDYITRIEIPTAIEKNKIIIPIIIKACDWEDSELGKYQAAKRGRIVSLDNDMRLFGKNRSLTSEEKAAFWTDIIKELRTKLFSSK